MPFLMMIALIASLLSMISSSCNLILTTRHLVLSALQDPRVILWSRSDLLNQYENGTWTAKEVMVSTVLLQSDTKVYIVSNCIEGKPRVTGIKVLSGKYKGRYGWVDTRDIL